MCLARIWLRIFMMFGPSSLALVVVVGRGVLVDITEVAAVWGFRSAGATGRSNREAAMFGSPVAVR